MSKPPETILIVDDEDSVRMVAVRLLERLHYRAISAGSANQAMSVLQQDGASIAGALIDLTMPGTPGDALAGMIRERYPAIRIILMSGYSADDIADNYTNLHIEGFLQKPFSRIELEQAVGSLLRPTP